ENHPNINSNVQSGEIQCVQYSPENPDYRRAAENAAAASYKKLGCKKWNELKDGGLGSSVTWEPTPHQVDATTVTKMPLFSDFACSVVIPTEISACTFNGR
ncbi:hypothetical protein KKC94_05985, partial [Patescibacteria group bacterium]|nr:hypothetical protein [Patescibacteria group bacterium]